MPPGIVGLPDDVVLHAVGIQLVEEPFSLRRVATLIDVDHDARAHAVARAGFHAGDSGLDEIGEVVPIGRQFGVGPEHSVADFVTDLDHVREHAGFTEGDGGLLRVVEQGLNHLVVRHTFPRPGDELLAGVGPGVRVVIVEQKAVAQLAGRFGQGDGVLQAVGELRRGVEQAQTDPVVTGFVVVFEDGTAVFILLEKG